MRELLNIYGHFVFPWIVAVVGLILMRTSAKKITAIVLAWEAKRRDFYLYEKQFKSIWANHEKRTELLMWYILLFGSFALEYVAYWYYQLLHNL